MVIMKKWFRCVFMRMMWSTPTFSFGRIIRQLSAVRLQKVQDHSVCPSEASLYGVLTAPTIAAQCVGGILKNVL